MTVDSVVQEVREAREAYAAQFNFDLEAICRDLKERERASGRRIVSLPPKRLKPLSQASPASPESG